MGHLRGWVVLVAALFLAAGCHAQEEIAELQRVKGDLKACRNGLNYLEDDKDICMKRQAELQASIKGLQIRLTNAEVHEQMLEELKEETDLVRKELVVSQDRLAMCETNIRNHDSREKACREDLDLAQVALETAAARQAETEKELRQKDCAATRRNLAKYRDTAEQFSIENDTLKKGARQAAEKWAKEKEALQKEIVKAQEQCVVDTEALEKKHANKVEALEKKISNLSDVVDTLPSLEARVAAAESARVEVQMELAREQARGEQAKAERSKAESETQGVVAELDATKKALKSLLDSLDSRQKYEALLQEHNKEWLPHWLKEHLASTNAILSAATASIWGETKAISKKFWELQIRPGLTKIDAALSALPGWGGLRTLLTHSVSSLIQLFLNVGIGAIRGIVHAEEGAERFVVGKLESIDSLRFLARPGLVHFSLWGTIMSIIVPLVIIAAQFLGGKLVYLLRTGTAVVCPVSQDSHLKFHIEELLEYTFNHKNNLEAAFSDASRPRMAFLGAAVAQTLAAETVVNKLPEDEPYRALQLAKELITSSGSLAAVAREVGVAALVQPGPGARSAAVAQATRGELYTACLGAVYIDSEFDIQAARGVWQRSSQVVDQFLLQFNLQKESNAPNSQWSPAESGTAAAGDKSGIMSSDLAESQADNTLFHSGVAGNSEIESLGGERSDWRTAVDSADTATATVDVEAEERERYAEGSSGDGVGTFGESLEVKEKVIKGELEGRTETQWESFITSDDPSAAGSAAGDVPRNIEDSGLNANEKSSKGLASDGEGSSSGRALEADGDTHSENGNDREEAGHTTGKDVSSSSDKGDGTDSNDENEFLEDIADAGLDSELERKKGRAAVSEVETAAKSEGQSR